MRNQTGINENQNQVLTQKKQNALQAGRLSPSRGRCPKEREGLDHEEQRFLENHHSGGGVYPDGSVDCFGNDLMHERHAVKCKMLNVKCRM